MILFERVTKRYPNGREALRAASFSIDRGEMVFLTGRSGAGKSTVLKLIAMLERPTRGTVVVNGQNLATLKSRHLPAYRRSLGVVFQEHRLLDDRPVFDNVALPLVVAGANQAREVRVGSSSGGPSAPSTWLVLSARNVCDDFDAVRHRLHSRTELSGNTAASVHDT